jgi:hypothetical protein
MPAEQTCTTNGRVKQTSQDFPDLVLRVVTYADILLELESGILRLFSLFPRSCQRFKELFPIPLWELDSERIIF